MRLIPLLALALVLGAGPRAALAADDPAVQLIRSLYGKFSETVKDGAGPLPARIDAVGPAMEQTFDFPVMIRLAAGPKWSGFTPEQQGALTEAFRRNFVVTYANRLSQAAGGKFEVTDKTETRDANRIVQTKVTTPDGDDSQVDFIVNGDTRVQDVLFNGNVSEVATQRAAFAQPIKAGGADALLKFLRQRTEATLSAKRAP